MLLGISVNGVDLEKRFVAAASRLGVPTLAVLDFWSVYRERFADATGRLAYLPDRVAVMDRPARDGVVAAGVPAERVTVTGQPAFDELFAYRAGVTESRRAACRDRWGCGAGERVVVFFSQPLANLTPPGHPRYPGYTEHEAVGLVADACDRAETEAGTPVVLVLRPHPRESADELVRSASRAGRVVLDEEGDRRAAALAADLVCGMTTVVLVEACLLGCVTLSVQPGLCLPDALTTNLTGATRSVYKTAGVAPFVRDLLFDPATRAAAVTATGRFRHEPGAADRVVQVFDELLALRQPDSGATT